MCIGHVKRNFLGEQVWRIHIFIFLNSSSATMFMKMKKSSAKFLNQRYLCCIVSVMIFLSICTPIIITRLADNTSLMLLESEIDFQQGMEETGPGMESQGNKGTEVSMQGKEEIVKGMLSQGKKGTKGSISCPRWLVGNLGSYVPQCNNKYGKCTPCLLLLELFQPGKHETEVYYPMAWRCNCVRDEYKAKEDETSGISSGG